jgi:4-amino-4-deoxy-L-arabinose transferase-like glycosyltransferase
MTLETYRLFGPRPLAAKLMNAALAAGGIAAIVAAFAIVFSRTIALASGIALALWPSHVFYTSQNLKESPILALFFGGFSAALVLGSNPPDTAARRAALAVSAVVGLAATGFFRAPVLLCASVALFAGFAPAAIRRKHGHALAVLAVAVSATAFYSWASHSLYTALERPGEESEYTLAVARYNRPALLPETAVDGKGTVISRPSSPANLSAFRRARQETDRIWALANGNREIGTQIFPDVEFHSWFDLLSYLPKAAFYVLFMPLPGLYPTEGKLGRIAASVENLVLLALTCFAITGIVRGPRTSGRAAVVLFFAAMATGAALLEFDLGSAGRHKLLYLPMLFPFAAEEILRLLGRKEPT